MHRFSFNLLPEKPKEEIVKEETRESTSLFLAVLPLLAVIVSIVLIIINNIVLRTNISNWEKQNSDRDNQIRGFEEVITLNIEFASKTELLEEPVQKDVEPEQFFNLSDAVLNTLPFSVEIKRYGRNLDGSFDITLTTDDIRDSADILRAFETNDSIDYANMKGIVVNEEDNLVDTTISFFISEEAALAAAQTTN